MIEYAASIIEDRLRALTRGLDAHPSLPGRITAYSGVRPTAGQAPSVGNLALAHTAFPKPSALAFESGLLTVGLPSTTLVQVNGIAEWARLTDGFGAFVADLDMGVDPLTDDVLIFKPNGQLAESAQLYAGGELSVGLVTLEEA
jgi:hypothetical protein